MKITVIENLQQFVYTINGVNYTLYDYIMEHADSNKWWYSSDVERKMGISAKTVRRRRQEFIYPSVYINGTYYYPSIFFEKILLLQTFYQKIDR